MEPLLFSEALKALRFLRVVNAQDVLPTLEEVVAFAIAREPRRGYEGNISSWAYDHLFGLSRTDLQKYLVSSGLVDITDRRVRISDAGAALILSIESGAEESDAVVEITGRATDPVFYAKLLTEIDKREDAMLVDPYLPSDILYSLLPLPGVQRILTNEGANGRKIAGEDVEARKRAMAFAMGTSKFGAELRLQAADGRELHDRVLLPRTGEGLMIGTSLGGSQMTAVTHLTEDATTVLRDHYDAIYELATPVIPVTREADAPVLANVDEVGASPEGNPRS